MRFGRRAHAGRMLTVEITPMIDVVFLLIIFFMTAARFARDTRAELELPREKGGQQAQAEEEGLVINLDASGRIMVGPEAVDLEGLERAVRAEIAGLPGREPARLKLMIRADRRADTARLNQVLTRLQALGVGAARLATEVP